MRTPENQIPSSPRPVSTRPPHPIRRAASTGGNFISGLMDPWRGLGFLMSHASLWHLAVLPFLLSLGLYIGIIWLGWHFIHDWLSAHLFSGGWFREILGYLLAIIFWLLTLIAAAFAFVPIATLVANPFNDMLSEKTERLYSGVEQPGFSPRRMFQVLVTGLGGEIRRIATLAFLLAFAYCFNFIPGFGHPIAVALSAFFTITYLSLEYTSFSMDRRLYRWTAKKEYLKRHRARTLGFGTMAFLILTVPIVNAFFIPISAVAGTLLFCDTELEDRASGDC